MIVIEVDNAKCKISGLNEAQNQSIYNKLSYEESQTIFLKLRNPKLFGMDLRKHLFTPKRCTFPTGLLYKVLECLKGQQVKIIDNRVTPDKVNYYPLDVPFNPNRYYQDDALKIILDNPTTTLEMCTGSGKTQLINRTIHERGVNTIVLVPTLNLLDQFYSTAEYHFGHKYVGTHKDKKQKPITIANIQGVQKKDQAWWDYYQQVIIDEAHHQASNSYYELNKEYWDHIRYRLSVSATAFRNDGSDMKLEAISGPVAYQYGARQAVKDKFITPPHFVVYKMKHFHAPSNGWHADYDMYLVNNKPRNDKIIEVVNKFAKLDKNILILANRIEHVDKLAEQIPDAVIVTGETSGNEKTFERYRMGKIKCMVATSQVVGEGIDIPNIDVLILAGGYESEILINQAIGRVVRLDKERGKKFGIVIDFLDEGNSILERHSLERIRIFKETYGKEFVRIV